MAEGQAIVDKRLDALITLITASTEQQIVTAVISDLTDAQRSAMVEAVVQRTVAAVNAGVADEVINAVVKSHVQARVAALVESRWAQVATRASEVIAARVEHYLSADKIADVVDRIAPARVSTAVANKVGEIVNALRNHRHR